MLGWAHKTSPFLGYGLQTVLRAEPLFSDIKETVARKLGVFEESEIALLNLA